MTTERDPRINPKPGDVVAKGFTKRTVVHVPGYSANDVWYWTKDADTKRNCWITTWRDWCRNAIVTHNADWSKP